MYRSRPIGYLSFALLAMIGCAGEDGEQGPQGAQGPAGAAGAAGADGMAGAAGEIGPAGQNGQDGRSVLLTGPGVKLVLESAAIAGDGTMTTIFKVTDEGDLPLDIDGRFTAGAVTIRFIAAYLGENQPGDPLTYTAYTTRVQTSSTGVSHVQASTDTNGTFEVLDVATGRYRYTFGTKATNVQPGLTHTIAAYATRTFEELRYVANETLDFRPDNATVVTTREIVDDESCNGCHGDLSAHGGARKTVAVCITCHSPQSVDPDSGNSVDMAMMIHKIHMGASLPSVALGTPYRIIGFQGEVHDYSSVHFPQENARCEACHQGAQADVWKTRPSVESCGSCHDRTSFTDPPPAGYTLHGGGVPAPGAQCVTCHPATGAPGQSGFPVSVEFAHLTPGRDPTKKIEVDILSVTNTAPGQTPLTRFRVRVGGAPRNIVASPLTVMRITAAGPNSDYGEYLQATIQGTPFTGEPAGTLTAVNAADGVFEFTSPRISIPADAEGSGSMAIEAYLQPTQADPRVAAFSTVFPFAITGAVVPRREVVSAEKCNGCHYELSEHGGSRKNVAYCAMCHHPRNPNDDRAPRLEGEDVYVHSTDLKRMIHSIHGGEQLHGAPYVLGGFPAPSEADPDGTPVDFSHLRYPRPINDCKACHVQRDLEWTATDELEWTYTLPLSPDLDLTVEQVRTCSEPPADDTDGYCDAPNWNVSEEILIAPATAACTSCHSSSDAMIHAQLMTAVVGEGEGRRLVESCAVCHGPGRESDVEKVHAALSAE